MKTYTKKEVARAIANVIAQDIGISCQDKAGGARRVGELLGIDEEEIERIRADLLIDKENQGLARSY